MSNTVERTRGHNGQVKLEHQVHFEVTESQCAVNKTQSRASSDVANALRATKDA